jgi:hypothetical protein
MIAVVVSFNLDNVAQAVEPSQSSGGPEGSPAGAFRPKSGKQANTFLLHVAKISVSPSE